jgi:hypothetical protein
MQTKIKTGLAKSDTEILNLLFLSTQDGGNKIDSGAKGRYRTAVNGATQFKTQTLTGEERKLNNDVIHHLNYSTSVIRNTKLRMRCVGNVACIWKRKTNT